MSNSLNYYRTQGPVCVLFMTYFDVYRSMPYIYNMKHILSVVVAAVSIFHCVSSQSSSPLPSSSTAQAGALGPTCLQPRDSSDPTGTTIVAALGRKATVNSACTLPSAHIDTATSTSYYILNGDYTFNSSFQAGPSGLPSTTCEINFNTILADCVESGNFWGGWVANDASNFSSRNYC